MLETYISSIRNTKRECRIFHQAINRRFIASHVKSAFNKMLTLSLGTGQSEWAYSGQVVVTTDKKSGKGVNEIRVLGKSRGSSHSSPWKRAMLFWPDGTSQSTPGSYFPGNVEHEIERVVCLRVSAMGGWKGSARPNPEFTNRENVTACHEGGTERVFGVTSEHCKTWRGWEITEICIFATRSVLVITATEGGAYETSIL